jgi:hypothetical protein
MTGPYDDGDEDVQRPDITLVKAILALAVFVVVLLLVTMCVPR